MVRKDYPVTGGEYVRFQAFRKQTNVAVAEVDLNQPYIGPWDLGDLRAMIPRHRPLLNGENAAKWHPF
jgi:hypothetical protein